MVVTVHLDSLQVNPEFKDNTLEPKGEVSLSDPCTIKTMHVSQFSSCNK